MDNTSPSVIHACCPTRTHVFDAQGCLTAFLFCFLLAGTMALPLRWPRALSRSLFLLLYNCIIKSECLELLVRSVCVLVVLRCNCMGLRVCVCVRLLGSFWLCFWWSLIVACWQHANMHFSISKIFAVDVSATNVLQHY